MSNRPQRVALITGGSRGLGLAVAEQLAAAGFSLAIHGRRGAAEVASVVEHLKTETELAGQGAEVIYCQADIADVADRQRMVDQICDSCGRLDVLVNHAGVAPVERADILDVSAASLASLIASSLKGPYFLTQLVARWMVRQRQADSDFSGVIVNVSSGTAELASMKLGDYGISKTGLSMATKLWAMRLAEYGIQVYEVCPGIFRTDLTDAVQAKFDQLIDDGLTLDQRWADPAELGRAVKLLVSGELTYATGNVLNIDGGLTLPRL